MLAGAVRITPTADGPNMVSGAGNFAGRAVLADTDLRVAATVFGHGTSMQQNLNVAAQERFGQAINSGDFSVFDEIVAADVLDHDPAPGQGGGPEGYKTFFGAFRHAFPDLKVSVDHLVTDDDNVAIAYTVTGTHRGEFLGHAPAGKPIRVRGMQIARFRDGKMVERWGSSDELGILKQIGAA